MYLKNIVFSYGVRWLCSSAAITLLDFCGLVLIAPIRHQVAVIGDLR